MQKYTHNRRVRGKSGRLRQVDVSITRRIGPYPTFIAIECKRYKRPVGIEKVEAFVSKLEDIGAYPGIMISNAGFDSGAQAAAERKGIVLLSYQEASDLDWNRATRSEAWVDLFITTPAVEAAKVHFEDTCDVEPHTSTHIYDEAGEAVTTLGEFMQKVIDSMPYGVVGNFDLRCVPQNPIFVKVADRLVRIDWIEVTGEVQCRMYTINLVLGSGHILHEAGGNKIVIEQLNSQSWDLEELARLPGREISRAEFQERMAPMKGRSLIRARMSELKRYMRVSISRKLDS